MPFPRNRPKGIKVHKPKKRSFGATVSPLRPIPKLHLRNPRVIEAYLWVGEFFGTLIPERRREIIKSLRKLRGKMTPKENMDLFILLEWLLNRKNARLNSHRAELFEMFPSQSRIFEAAMRKKREQVRNSGKGKR
ncbi:MAG: hypothetical protein Q7K42_06520 [Candidatus Diapherotrites archaeon]|nr:hypothetical protein [Candidatus Diapherotrites archaeon]